jgi:transcriptional regulator with XRE-family HTH domain
MPNDRPGYEAFRKEVRKRLAQNLRRERERLGLSQERAAERVGLSLQYLQRIERKIVNVPVDTVARFAHAYEVPPALLLKASSVRSGKGGS